MQFVVHSDHTTEQYSSIGLTYTRKTRSNNLLSLDMKHLSIILARLFQRYELTETDRE